MSVKPMSMGDAYNNVSISFIPEWAYGTCINVSWVFNMCEC